MQNVITCLWFNGTAAEAATFYVSLFKTARVLETAYYTFDMPPRKVGDVLTVRFELEGREFLALNGGPEFTHTPASSIIAYCETQAEVDHLWSKLTEGGQEVQCGWLTDRFGVSWQVTPKILIDLPTSPDKAAVNRMFQAMHGMKKLDIAGLKKAFDSKKA